MDTRRIPHTVAEHIFTAHLSLNGVSDTKNFLRIKYFRDLVYRLNSPTNLIFANFSLEPFCFYMAAVDGFYFGGTKIENVECRADLLKGWIQMYCRLSLRLTDLRRDLRQCRDRKYVIANRGWFF